MTATASTLAITGSSGDAAAVVFPAPATRSIGAGGIKGAPPVTLAIATSTTGATATSAANCRSATGTANTTGIAARRCDCAAGAGINSTGAQTFVAQGGSDLRDSRIGVGVATVVHQDHLAVLQLVNGVHDC